ncbi:MAG: hypothetical protein ACPGYV_09630, partial [Phycisphaeraceae bacterium]
MMTQSHRTNRPLASPTRRGPARRQMRRVVARTFRSFAKSAALVASIVALSGDRTSIAQEQPAIEPSP